MILVDVTERIITVQLQDITKIQMLNFYHSRYCLGRTCRKHLKKGLETQSNTSGSALFFKTFGNNLIGLSATYFDDTPHAGNYQYYQISKLTEQKFNCIPRQWNTVNFSWVQIEKLGTRIEMHQKSYISELREISEKSNYSDYRSLRAELLWFSNTRPDTCCFIARLAQIKERKSHQGAKKLSNILKLGEISLLNSQN